MAQPRQKQTTDSKTSLDKETTRKTFDFQRPEANDEVIQALFEMAKSGKSTTAAIFWAKAKCGMHEKGSKKGRKTNQAPTIIIRNEEKRA